MLRKLIVLLMLCGFAAHHSHAEEPYDRYLTALQERGHYDVALRYLDHMASSSLAPARLKQALDYRRGMLFVNSARVLKTPAERQNKLDAAEQALQRFVSQHPKHTSAPLARSQLGNVIVERARSLVLRAQDDAQSRPQLMRQAGEVYATAHASLTQSREELGKQYKSLATKRDSESKTLLESTKNQYVQTYLAIARVLFEQAETVQHDAKQYKAKLTESAEAFEEVAQKYRNYGAGIYALLYEGQCSQLMGEHNRALNYFKELRQNPDNSPGVRRLKTKSLALSIESWLALDKTIGPDRAINAATAWIKATRGAEDRDPAWYELRLALAKAYQSKSNVAQKDIQATRAIHEARKLANDLAKPRSPVRKEAQTLLVALGRGKPATKVDTTNLDSNATFAEAHAVAEQALAEMKTSSATVSILASQLDTVRDSDRRAEIESRLVAARELFDAAILKTAGLFERTASLATEEDADELNGVRYYLAYLYYKQGRLRHAAVLASHVATHFPDSLAARECASVALAARQRLYQQAAPEDRELQSAKIAEIAELTVAQWPGQPQADAALTTLLDVTVRRGDLKKAEEYLALIPQDSPKRATAELRTGQAVWREYLQGVAAQQTGDAAYSNPNLEQLKQRAQQMLAKGVERSVNATPSESVIRSALSLAQIYVDSGQPQKALELLNRDGFGALRLVESNSPWATRIQGLASEAYKTGIRAHVATAANSGDTAGSIESAQRMLERLQKQMAGRPDGQQRMIRIYVGLARDLERQLTIASPSARQALSQGFESFLQGAAKGTSDVAVLNWVGETFYSLGNGMLQDGNSSPEAQRYFTEASKAYSKVLSAGAEKLAPGAMMQVRVRQAMSLRQLGKYQQSIEIFADVLRERNKVLNVQVEAAKTLQQWGRSDPEAYWKAIMGDQPGKNSRNVIWGWGRIAKIVAKNSEYRDTFHLARYGIAFCRYKYALSQSSKKQDLLARARTDVTMTKQAFGLGSPAQERRYEELLKQIEKSLAKK